MSYKVEVKTRNENNFVGNSLEFTTLDEAKQYGEDLSRRWTLVEEWRVKEPVTGEIIFSTEWGK